MEKVPADLWVKILHRFEDAEGIRCCLALLSTCKSLYSFQQAVVQCRMLLHMEGCVTS